MISLKQHLDNVVNVLLKQPNINANHYRQDAAKRSGKLSVLNLLTGQKSGFLPRRGDSLHRFTSNLVWPTGTWVRLAVQNFTSIDTVGGNAATKYQTFPFLVKSRLPGANPLTDSYNFTGFYTTNSLLFYISSSYLT